MSEREAGRELDAEPMRKRKRKRGLAWWQVVCPVCDGWGELYGAVSAWDVPGAPVPECPHCDDGVLDVTPLFALSREEARAILENRFSIHAQTPTPESAVPEPSVPQKSAPEETK